MEPKKRPKRRGLTAPAREMVPVWYQQGYTPNRIAAGLGVSAVTVNKLLRKLKLRP